MSQEITDRGDVLKVWATVFTSHDGMGVRVPSIVDRTKLSLNTVNCALDYLVALEFVRYKMLQSGTGGSQEKFYAVCDGVALTRVNEQLS